MTNPQKKINHKDSLEVQTKNAIYNVISDKLNLAEKLQEIKDEIAECRSSIETYNNNLEDQENLLIELIDEINSTDSPRLLINGKLMEVRIDIKEITLDEYDEYIVKNNL